MADAPVGARPAHLSPRGRTAVALALALAALSLLFVRSWRIDYDYSIDFQTYWLAGHRIASGEPERLYDAGGGPADGTPAVMEPHEFKNIPLLALPFAPLARVDYLGAKRLFWWLALAALVAGAALSGARLLPESFGPATARAAIAVAGTAALAPAHAALRHGQTTPFVMLALALALAARERSREGAAGAWIGAASLVKFPPLALAALDLARLRWRAATLAAATLAAAVAASVVAFGPALNRAYLDGIAQHAGAVMTGHNNQSLLSIAMRLAHPSLVNDWTPRPAPAGVVAAAGVATLALAAVAAWALYARPRGGDWRLEAPLALAAGTIVLPVAWDHYMVLLVPALCSLAAGLHARGILTRPSFALPLAAAYAILALPTPEALLAEGVAGPLAALAISGDGIAALSVFAVAAAALREEAR